MNIHIAYENTDTTVLMVPTHPLYKKYFRTKTGNDVKSIRTIAFNKDQRWEKLNLNPNITQKLKDEDIEIDLTIIGKIISRTHQIVVNRNYDPVYDFIEIDRLTKTDGTQITRSHKKYNTNINSTIPVLISQQYYSPEQLLIKYIFRKSYFLIHTDGISYKFLYDIANNLATHNKFTKLIAFDKEKTPGPLVLYRGGLPFAAAYLEGKVKGDSYSLVLHLADRELILPKQMEIEKSTELETES